MENQRLDHLITNYSIEVRPTTSHTAPLTLVFKEYDDPALCDSTSIVEEVPVNRQLERYLREKYGYIFAHFNL